MADFSGGDFASQAAASGFYGDYSGPAAAAPDASQYTSLGDLSSMLGGDTGGGGGPGTPSVAPAVGGGLGALIGDFFGGPIGGAVGGAAGEYLGGMYASSGTAGMRPRGRHLNKTTYYTKSGRVAKGTKMVTNRRRNAGNAKAVRRALGRLAMFDNLARKVEGEMARVARRHHRAAPRRAAPHRGHRAGCKCFACRR